MHIVPLFEHKFFQHEITQHLVHVIGSAIEPAGIRMLAPGPRDAIETSREISRCHKTRPFQTNFKVLR